MTIEVKTGAGYVPVVEPLMKVSDDTVPYKRNGPYDTIVVDSAPLWGASPKWSHKWKLKFTLQGLKVKKGLKDGVNGFGFVNTSIFQMKAGNGLQVYADLYIPIYYNSPPDAAAIGTTSTHCPVALKLYTKTGWRRTDWMVPWGELNKEVVTFEITGAPDDGALTTNNNATLKINGIEYQSADMNVDTSLTTPRDDTYTQDRFSFGGAINSEEQQGTPIWSLPFDAVYDEEFTAPDGTVTKDFLKGVIGNLPHNLSTVSPWQPPKQVFRKEQSGWEVGSRAYMKPVIVGNGEASAYRFCMYKFNLKNDFNVEFKMKNAKPIVSTNDALSDLFLHKLRKDDGSEGYFWLVHYWSKTSTFSIAKYAEDGSLRVDYFFDVPRAELTGDITIRIENNGIDPTTAPSIFINGALHSSDPARTKQTANPSEMADASAPFPWINSTPSQYRNAGGGVLELGGFTCDAAYDYKFEYSSEAGVAAGEEMFFPMDDLSNTFAAQVIKPDGSIQDSPPRFGFTGNSSESGEWFYD